MRKMRNAYTIFSGKHEGKRPLKRPKYRWQDNIIMQHTGRRLEGVDWIHLAQDRNRWRALLNTVMNLRVP
jgi:hypothetical protein